MQHVNIKIFANPPAPESLREVIPVFHRWIQQQALPELLIDVADYQHVPGGPGVMLIAHDAHYSLDLSGMRLGLLYNRRTPRDGTALENLLDAYQRARAAASRLAAEPEFLGRLTFSDVELEVTLNDRILYPNTEATWSQTESAFTAFFDSLYGTGGYTLARPASPRERFRVHVTRNRT